jgi:hypothetical protein
MEGTHSSGLGEAPRQLPICQLLRPEVSSDLAILDQSVFTRLSTLESGISRLSPADAHLFRQAFQKEEVCYANSWLYTLRSTRSDLGGFGYKFVGNETLVSIGYHNNSIFLVHPMGPKRFQTVVGLCAKIYNSLKCRIILKKMDQELYEQLQSTKLFQEYTGDLTLLEEEAFSEHVLELEKLYSPSVGLYNQSIPFMRKVKRFEKNPIELVAEAEISDIEGNPGFYNLLGYNPEKYYSYSQIINEVRSQRSNNGKYKVCTYYDEKGTIHGLYTAELLEEGRMGLYCAVSSRSFPGITEWMDYDFFKRVFNDGMDYLYFGGSETVGVDAYVKKLLPDVPSYLMRPMEACYRA